MIASGYFSQALFGTLTQGLTVTEDYRFELLFEQLLGGALGLCGIRAEELAYSTLAFPEGVSGRVPYASAVNSRPCRSLSSEVWPPV